MIKYVILGAIQGFTEFLPVSSSGHLIIAGKILGLHGEEVALSVILHLGTLLAVTLFFFKDILILFRDKKRLLLVILVTVITGSIGVLGKDFFEAMFTSVKVAAIALFVTGVILVFTKKARQAVKKSVGLKDSLVLSITQAAAIIPGISRSGITISTLIFRQVNKEESFRFSFLVSVPLILGAAVLESRKINLSLAHNYLNLGIGFLVSAITGFIALLFLKFVIGKAKFHFFGYYCLALSILTLIFIK